MWVARGRALRGVGHGQAQVGALALRDGLRGEHGLPHVRDHVEEERPPRAQDGLGLADLRLHDRAIAQQLRGRARHLHLRQLDERVDGRARHAQAHAAEAAAGEVEAVHAVHRPGDPRATVERRERPLLGHEQVLDLDVVAARAAQAR